MKTSQQLNLKRALLIMLKGFAMGAADVVPGVSGGTIAFITGIYERLITAISHVDQHLLLCLSKRRWQQAWQHADIGFLLLLFAGIATSIFSLAHLISYLLATVPLFVWSFFMGLVLASGLMLLRDIGRWAWPAALCLLAGIATALAVSALRPVHIEPSLMYVFCSGMIAICAMLLPGISGSFLLLVLGVYGFVLEAVKSLDVVVIAVFMAGAGIGILGFAKLLAYLLQTVRVQIFALLTGFLLGSTALIWPWKITDANAMAVNVSPAHYAQVYGESAQLLACSGFFGAGLLLVLALSLLKTD